MRLFSVRSGSAEQTGQFGRQLGGLLLPGSRVLLQGDLGAGKTCLATGIARGLGISDEVAVTSPTYTLLNSYVGRLDLYHFDLYRLGDDADMAELGFDEYLYGDGVSLVEWPQRCPDLFENALLIHLHYLEEQVRCIEISIPAGALYQPLEQWLSSGRGMEITALEAIIPQ